MNEETREHRFRLHPSAGRTYYTCPDCNQNTLIPYIDTKREFTFPEYVGMCDRPSKCGYHFPPKRFFEEAKSKGMDLHLPKKVRSSAPAPPPEPDYIDLQAIEQFARYGINTILCQFLAQALDHLHPARPLEETLSLYRVGGLTDRRIVFPLIDTSGHVRSAKVMRYWYDGHRSKDKADKGRFNWLHGMRELVPVSMLHIHGAAFKLSQAWFGSHLLPIFPTAPVAIVESEKTALIMTCIRPQYIWLATGGMRNFVPDKAPSLQGRKVYVYADADGHKEWEQRTSVLIAAKVLPADTMFPKWYVSEPEGSKRDIADLLLDAAPLPFVPPRAERNTTVNLPSAPSDPLPPEARSNTPSTSSNNLPAPAQDAAPVFPVPSEHPFPAPFDQYAVLLRNIECTHFARFTFDPAPQGYTLTEWNNPSRAGVAYYLLDHLDPPTDLWRDPRKIFYSKYNQDIEGERFRIMETPHRIKAQGKVNGRLFTFDVFVKDGHPAGIAWCWEGYYERLIICDWYNDEGHRFRRQAWPRLTNEEYDQAMKAAKEKYTWTPANPYTYFPF